MSDSRLNFDFAKDEKSSRFFEGPANAESGHAIPDAEVDEISHTPNTQKGTSPAESYRDPVFQGRKHEFKTYLLDKK